MPDDRGRKPKQPKQEPLRLNKAQVNAEAIRRARQARGVMVVILASDGRLDVGAAFIEGAGAAPLIDLYDTLSKRIDEVEGAAAVEGEVRRRSSS